MKRATTSIFIKIIVLIVSMFYIIYFLRTPRVDDYSPKNLEKLVDTELDSSPICKTKTRGLFDRHLERDGRYEYLKWNTTEYEVRRSDLLLIDKLILDNGVRPKDTRSKRKYFFSMNLFNNEEVIPHLIQELLLVIKFLGAKNVFLSIYENGSNDQTKEMLGNLKTYLKSMDVRNNIVVDDEPRPKSYHRIDYLASVRNKALAPLWTDEKKGLLYDKVVFMNDVYFCRNDILELIYQSDFQVADLVAPLDVRSDNEAPPNLFFRDDWVARDLKGELFNRDLDKGPNHSESRIRNRNFLPFQVQCSWNGAVVINSKAFYGKNAIKFRRSDKKTSECSASECSLFCNDMWRAGMRRLIVAPKVLVSYKIKTAKLLDSRRVLALNTTTKLVERVKYIDGPTDIVCREMVGDNLLHPDMPDRKIKYTDDDTKVY
ncbi:Alpha-1,3-mannosyltransferase CMT1 [Smittium mucronatum]|uniref:Alpha-1,3-mannosyltransferase CMT1 n=1 Tax=Smittium mucronatum TaxID=133383 RepID=A0A1R0GX34_9FUNG|nr:Alpha-1,3-mannosyltransferase CMT1 [Smittium mucronatum]